MVSNRDLMVSREIFGHRKLRKDDTLKGTELLLKLQKDYTLTLTFLQLLKVFMQLLLWKVQIF